MPYDPIKVKKALHTALAYQRFPGAEFVQEMATLLKDADEAIGGAYEQLRAAETQTRRLQIDADQVRSDYKLLRETSAANYERLLVAMKDIASSARGGKSKAIDALKSCGIEVPKTEAQDAQP